MLRAFCLADPELEKFSIWKGSDADALFVGVTSCMSLLNNGLLTTPQQLHDVLFGRALGGRSMLLPADSNFFLYGCQDAAGAGIESMTLDNGASILAATFMGCHASLRRVAGSDHGAVSVERWRRVPRDAAQRRVLQRAAAPGMRCQLPGKQWLAGCRCAAAAAAPVRHGLSRLVAVHVSSDGFVAGPTARIPRDCEPRHVPRGA